jgi:hypothetical protein
MLICQKVSKVALQCGRFNHVQDVDDRLHTSRLKFIYNNLQTKNPVLVKDACTIKQ